MLILLLHLIFFKVGQCSIHDLDAGWRSCSVAWLGDIGHAFTEASLCLKQLWLGLST
ncbi:hypothetical protein KC19_4G060700 [Ceratodon purpureus]|uniref:Uncharacterized protein n=1 Tax=Ceratodon purpureus TaxID=3225 RepID=A0A8T0I8Y3_CERPU|nr:hypothetical protein KC19_4G060700 [Ceratodon purpureus]